MSKYANFSRFSFALALIGLGALFRVLPHAPNFTPVAAMALFGGAVFVNRRDALLVILFAMLISDFIIGFDTLTPIVYGCLAVMVFLGAWAKRSGAALAGATLISSVLFFVVTNFAVWALQGMYPKTLAGLLACFTAAIPFFHYTLLGDLLFVGLFFGVTALAERLSPIFRPV